MKNSFAAIGKNVVQTEIDALKKLKKSINKDFDKIVNVILKCKGKIVFSGVGKSGIVSKKISSTLASIGIPTFYVDAGSCSHGDLGMISSNDVIILISHSGESEELKNIIKYAKRNRNLTLIGITSKKNSLLYKSSDLKFLLPTITEAGPGNYIPTSSTTLQMCLGDALALSTIRQRKFSKLDFKKYHPSGSLGSKLKTVGELMFKGKDIPLGVWNNNTHEMLVQVKKAKQWVKQNPDKDPALFFKPEPEKDYQSLYDAWSIYWKYYCTKSSDDTIRDRRNKWNRRDRKN